MVFLVMIGTKLIKLMEILAIALNMRNFLIKSIRYNV